MKPLTWVAVLLAGVATSAAAADPAPRIALVRDHAVCVAGGELTQQCFPAVARAPSLPVWSRDGQRIAFVDTPVPSAGQSALPVLVLVVIDARGRLVSRSPIIEPTGGTPRSGMRFVERIEWLGEDRVAVSGSLNPSTVQALVFDAASGREVAEHGSDGELSFSPDGRQVLTVAGAPHFSGEHPRVPTLQLNGRRLLEDLHGDLGANGPARWSADSRAFAWVARSQRGGWQLVLGQVMPGGAGRARWVDLPFTLAEDEALPTLFWSGAVLHLQRSAAAQRQDWAWSAAPAPGAWRLQSVPATAPATAAAMLRQQVLAGQASQGAADADAWCRDCALDRVARRSGGTF